MGDKEDPKTIDQKEIPVKFVGGRDHNFLNLLRAADPGAYHGERNDDTLRASNSTSGASHRSTPSNLSDLFDPTPREESSLSPKSPSFPSRPMSPPQQGGMLPPRAPLPRPDPLHKRNRSVSFDKEALMHKPVSDSVMQPNLMEALEEGSVGSHASRPSLKGSRAISLNLGALGRNRQQSTRKLTIDDLLGTGKYESEAETSILKALEEHQLQNATSHERNRSETSTILSGVPDAVAHDFSVDSGIRKDSSQDDDETSSRGSSLNKQQSKPLLTRQRSVKSGGRNHRKTMSVEDRLAGLTIAMWNMEDSDEDGSGEFPSLKGSSPVSSGEHFGKTVAMIAAHDNPMPPRTRLDSLASSYLLPVVDENETEEPASSEDAKDTSSADNDDNFSPGNPSEPSSKHNRRHKGRRPNRRSSIIADKLKDDLDVWRTFFRPRREHIVAYMKRMFLYLIVPFIGVAAILFYFADNIPTGKSADGSPGLQASASWWLLFVVRQVVTFSLALFLQVVIIDFLCIGTKGMLRLLGPLLTLLIVQSKGWPFVVFCWSILDFGMLYGSNAFVQHWGYFQEVVGLFNNENPSGGIVASDWNKRVLLIGVTVSIFVALKRFVVGLVLGRQTFHHYGEQLAKVMDKMVLVGEVGFLAKRIYKSYSFKKQGLSDTVSNDIQTIRGMTLSYDEEDDDHSASFTTAKTLGAEKLIDTAKRDPLTGSLAKSEKDKLMQLIDRWEEPDRQAAKLKNQISISSVLKFRNALTFIRNDYPFSYAFGPAESRESCIDSAQECYNRLLLASTGDERVLCFETLAMIALQNDGTIEQRKAKNLIKTFRPDRDGCLSILDFVKSIDAVYKEFRLLQASIENSSQIDRAFENIVNVVFYTIVVTIIMSQLGFDPLALFLSMSSVILAFAFVIGSASSKYFEGLLFILVRRPYGIGDLIHVSNPETVTNIDGSTGWLVQHVTLFETTMTWLPTQETASVSNGSLASSRIINWARSPNARFVIFFVVPIETKYETLEVFKGAVEEYLKVRPREWLAFNAFRVVGVFADQGFMKIEVVVQHREAWQNVGAILDSRGNLISFCHEVQKMLGMEYHAPPLPVDLSGGNLNNGMLSVEREVETRPSGSQEILEKDAEEKSDLFRSVAQQRHNLKIG